MIKILLLILFLIGLLVTGGLSIFFAIDYFKKKSNLVEKENSITNKYGLQINSFRSTHSQIETAQFTNERQAQYEKELDELDKTNAPKLRRSKRFLFTFTAIAICFLCLLIVVPSSFHQVEAGTYAVVKRVGKIEDVKTPGTYFDFYFTKKYEIYDATVQQIKINTAAYSKDGQTMDLEVYLQYQIQLDKLVIRDSNGQIIQTEGIAGKYVTLASLQDRIETQCIEKTKAVMSSAEAMTIIEKRQEYSEKVSEVVREAIGPDYYVNVQDVVLTNIDFTDEFEKIVEDKVAAQQAALKAENDKARAITEAQAAEEVSKHEADAAKYRAQQEADAKLYTTEKEAEALLVKAQAEADAQKVKIEALGKAIKAMAVELGVTEVEAIKAYLNNEWIITWDGDVPTVITDSSTGYILNIE